MKTLDTISTSLVALSIAGCTPGFENKVCPDLTSIYKNMSEQPKANSKEIKKWLFKKLKTTKNAIKDCPGHARRILLERIEMETRQRIQNLKINKPDIKDLPCPPGEKPPVPKPKKEAPGKRIWMYS